MENLATQTMPLEKSRNRKHSPPPTLSRTSEVAGYLDDNVVVLRADQPITLGKKNYPQLPSTLIYRQKKSGYDTGGEMYYCVGNLYEEGLDQIKGFYVQVWHLRKEWKIVGDVIQLAN